ncbi:hypothetical protein FRB98_005717 [Tulasnella sp. 332]|nr:hypothetical protein FRB98_005717 [Tulasnella sp. 332]
MSVLLSTFKKVTPNVRRKGIRRKNTLPGGENSLPSLPSTNEAPELILKVQVVGCSDLLAKDKNGKSDPLGRDRHTTPVVKRNLNPEYNSKDATFEFSLYRSTIGNVGALQFVIWDKDLMSKDYLGETALSFEDLFKHQEPSPAYAFDDLRNTVFAVSIESTRKKTSAQGALRLKIGYAPVDKEVVPDYNAVHRDLQQLVTQTSLSLHSSVPTRGVGTAIMGADSELEDDGLSSGDEYSTDEYEPESGAPPRKASSQQAAVPAVAGPTPAPVKPSHSSSGGLLPRIIAPIRPSLSPRLSSGDVLPGSDTSRPPSRTKKIRPNFKRTFNSDYNFATNMNDTVGIVMLEVNRAEDLPKLKNMTRTGWDMDPFCVISFGKKVFRTRVIRHSLNPVWNEKLLFHVHRFETSFKVSLRVLDWDKLTGNDFIGGVSFDLAELMAHVPQPDPITGIYPEEVAKGDHDMTEYKLPVAAEKGAEWEFKHAPYLIFRAKYQPYRALRQRFWRQYLKQYDTDNSGLISHIEISSMLDTLGSTLSRETIDSFFTRFDQNPREGEITFDQAVQCLEDAVTMPRAQRKKVSPDGLMPETGANTPLIKGSPTEEYPNLGIQNLNFSGPSARASNDESVGVATINSKPQRDGQEPMQMPASTASEGLMPPKQLTPGMERTASDITINGDETPIVATPGQADTIPEVTTSIHPSDLSQQSTDHLADDLDDLEGPTSSAGDDVFERVINIKTCPLCHRPRMNSKAEGDIVTHLAVCASSDWARVDRMIVGNYVTASQAQRKWYSTVVSKISAGSYQLGANSGNIIVQNRMTGQLEEEKMQGYVRFGIRLLYKGAKGRMEGGRARRLLKSLSIKQGQKFDAPESAREIMPFIAFHNLPVEEIADPLESFKTFNQFFYRKLRMSYRPVTNPDDPRTVVSVADCRMMAFETIQDATKIWIKGREFTVAKLLGDHYKDEALKYTGGALGIFRLAPQDYHRFHAPVDGKIGPMTYITGEYYTVNPQAIRTTLDVYGENARKIVPIDSPIYGRVMAVCVGAMMVGTIVTTVEEGAEVKRGDEFGYFAFGGSTIVLLFEKGAIQWDEDILNNSQASLETLVRVCMGVGKAGRPPPTSRASSSITPA